MARSAAPRRMTEPPAAAPSRRRSSLPRLGPLVLTPFRAVIGLAFVGSGVYILWAILVVRDATQIPMLSSGFAVLGLACVAISLGGAIQMVRAARDGRGPQTFLFSVLGGAFGLAAIGCFTLTAVLALLWKSG